MGYRGNAIYRWPSEGWLAPRLVFASLGSLLTWSLLAGPLLGQSTRSTQQELKRIRQAKAAHLRMVRAKLRQAPFAQAKPRKATRYAPLGAPPPTEGVKLRQLARQRNPQAPTRRLPASSRSPRTLAPRRTAPFAPRPRRPIPQQLAGRPPARNYSTAAERALESLRRAFQPRGPEGACYALQRPPRRKSLENKCYAQLSIHHRSLDRSCAYRPQPLRHANLQTKCYPSFRIRHQSLDGYSCGAVAIRHRSPEALTCAPPAYRPPSPLERFARHIKVLLSNHRRHCKITALYSGLSAGEIVSTREHGAGVIVDYKLGRYATTFIRYRGADSTEAEIERRYVPGIRRLYVMVLRDANQPRTLDGMPLLRRVQLSEAETKALMLEHLIKRRRLLWLVRMYPEERQNLDLLLDRYTGEGRLSAP